MKKWILAIALSVLAAVVIFVLLRQLDFGPFNEQTQTARAPTVWDILELLVIPVFVAAGTWFLDRRERKRESDEQERKQNAEKDRLQREEMEAFIDRIENLLINHPMHIVEKDHSIRSSAQARLRNILQGLDETQKRILFRFLMDASLIRIQGDDDRKVGLLSKIDLSKAELTGMALDLVDLSNSDLTEAVFSYASLRDGRLSGSCILGTRFDKANLIKANLNNTTVRRKGEGIASPDSVGLSNEEAEEKVKKPKNPTSFREARMHEVLLQQANLTFVDLEKAILIKAHMEGAILDDANLKNARLDGVILTDAFLLRANLAGARLDNAKLIRTKLAGADLSGASLVNADITEADLNGVNFTNVTFERTKRGDELINSYVELQAVIEREKRGYSEQATTSSDSAEQRWGDEPESFYGAPISETGSE